MWREGVLSSEPRGYDIGDSGCDVLAKLGRLDDYLQTVTTEPRDALDFWQMTLTTQLRNLKSHLVVLQPDASGTGASTATCASPTISHHRGMKSILSALVEQCRTRPPPRPDRGLIPDMR